METTGAVRSQQPPRIQDEECKRWPPTVWVPLAGQQPLESFNEECNLWFSASSRNLDEECKYSDPTVVIALPFSAAAKDSR